MSIAPLIQHLFLGLAMFASMGALVHDTKIDKAYQLATPVVTSNTSLATSFESLRDGASHTHVEKVSAPVIGDGVQRAQARNEHRKYYLTKSLNRTSDFFGGSRILWPSV